MQDLTEWPASDINLYTSLNATLNCLCWSWSSWPKWQSIRCDKSISLTCFSCYKMLATGFSSFANCENELSVSGCYCCGGNLKVFCPPPSVLRSFCGVSVSVEYASEFEGLDYRHFGLILISCCGTSLYFKSSNSERSWSGTVVICFAAALTPIYELSGNYQWCGSKTAD